MDYVRSISRIDLCEPPLSDVLWIKGKIQDKYLDENGEHCVDIETSAINQHDEEVMPGDATVVLPSRERKIWPLDRRL